MKSDEDIPARPWRPASLQPQRDDTPAWARVVGIAGAIFVVATALLWLGRENGPPPAPMERAARARPNPPSRPESRLPPFPSSRQARRFDQDAAPSATSPLDSVTQSLSGPAVDSVAGRGAGVASGSPGASRAVTSIDAPLIDSRTRARQLMSLPALPPPTTPMSRARAVLEPRATAGDGVAACRLAFARARCEGEMRAGPIVPDGFCAGVDVHPLPRTEDVLQPAEPWLTPRQKVLLAMVRPDGGVARLARPGAPAPQGYVYPQYLADHAYEFLLEGFRARDPLALEGLAIVHAPGDPARWNRNGPVLPNPRLFVFYTGILQRLNGEGALGALARDTLAATRATLGPRELAEADARAAAEVGLWLQARARAVWQAEWEELQHGDLRLQDCAR